MTSSILLGILLLAPLPGVAATPEPPAPPQAESPSEPLPVPAPAPAQSELAPEPPKVAPVGPELKPPVGERCRSRSDCGPRRCLRNTCVDQETFEADRAARAKPDPDESARVFFGGAFGGPVPAVWNSQVGIGLQAAARFGVLISRLQFQLEVSPATTVLFDVDDKPVGMFEATGTLGFLVPLSPYASWIVRGGGGGGFAFPGVNEQLPRGASLRPATTGFTEIRVDVVGVAVRASDHLLLELNAPSVRVLFPTDSAPRGVMFVTALGFVYVF
jgi:hypothetical protein